MGRFGNEPVLAVVVGGSTIVQAFLQLLIAFDVPITSVRQAAIMTFTTLLLGFVARSQVTPVAPAGTVTDSTRRGL